MLSKETRDTYDLFELMECMESKGFMSKNRYWREYVLASYPTIANDMYMDMYFGEGTDKEINGYHAEVRKLLKIDYEDNVLMKICW
ncbi:hypothetical protein [Brevibacillus sp. NRS-1366]|uniref:hypothetical protein n=1 Tax=Brevibacillus sp. NRS-1366 TaxID=3233899 RepID=UPI003D2632F9